MGCWEGTDLDRLGRDVLKFNRSGRLRSEEHPLSRFIEKERWTGGGDSTLLGIGSTSGIESSTVVILGDCNGKRGCLRSSRGEIPESELAFDVDRCHENGRRGAGLGGITRSVFC